MEKDTWWLPKQKHYLEETKKWWCFSCRELTPLIRNPAWGGEFEGKRPAPEWFIKCGECGYKHFQTSGYECPDCGWDPEESIPVKCTTPKSCQWAAMEFGGSPVDWEETHFCPNCKEEFTFTNSNY